MYLFGDPVATVVPGKATGNVVRVTTHRPSTVLSIKLDSGSTSMGVLDRAQRPDLMSTVFGDYRVEPVVFYVIVPDWCKYFTSIASKSLVSLS